MPNRQMVRRASGPLSPGPHEKSVYDRIGDVIGAVREAHERPARPPELRIIDCIVCALLYNGGLGHKLI